MKKITNIISIVIFCIALLAVIGSVMQIPILTSWGTNFVSMKFVTAISITLSTLSLLIITHSPFHSLRILPISLESVSLSLMAYTVISRNAILSTISDTTSYTVAPQVPSIGTLSAIILLFIVGILYTKDMIKIIRRCGAILAMLGLIAVFGYIIGNPSLYFYIENISTAMALNTSICFVLLGVGLFIIRENKYENPFKTM